MGCVAMKTDNDGWEGMRGMKTARAVGGRAKQHGHETLTRPGEQYGVRETCRRGCSSMWALCGSGDCWR